VIARSLLIHFKRAEHFRAQRSREGDGTQSAGPLNNCEQLFALPLKKWSVIERDKDRSHDRTDNSGFWLVNCDLDNCPNQIAQGDLEKRWQEGGKPPNEIFKLVQS
jgi:hypothetical protein